MHKYMNVRTHNETGLEMTHMVNQLQKLQVCRNSRVVIVVVCYLLFHTILFFLLLLDIIFVTFVSMMNIRICAPK